MARRPREQPLVLDQHNDGPPQIQRVAILAVGGLIIRDAMVEQADRPDMEDPNASVRKKTVRMIRGWRRVWTIDTLHKTSPNEITEAHVAAAERLVGDHQRREGAITTGGRSGDGKMGPIDVRVAAGIEYDAALVAVGQQGAGILFRAAILNWTVTTLATKLDISRDRAFGRLQAALERLREHYDAGKKRKSSERTTMPSLAVEPAREPEDTGLPVERSGRWDRKPSPARTRAATESA